MHSLMQTSTAEDHNLPAWQQRARELATQAGQTMPTLVWGNQLLYDRRRDEIAVRGPRRATADGQKVHAEPGWDTS